MKLEQLLKPEAESIRTLIDVLGMKGQFYLGYKEHFVNPLFHYNTRTVSHKKILNLVNLLSSKGIPCIDSMVTKYMWKVEFCIYEQPLPF